jgi:hypothetical protein
MAQSLILEVLFSNCTSGFAKRPSATAAKAGSNSDCSVQLLFSSGQFRWSQPVPQNQSSIQRVVLFGDNGAGSNGRQLAIDCITAINNDGKRFGPNPKFIVGKNTVQFALPIRCLLNSCGAVTLTGTLETKGAAWKLVKCQFSYLANYSSDDLLPFCLDPGSDCKVKRPNRAYFYGLCGAKSFDELCQVLETTGVNIDQMNGTIPGDEFVVATDTYSPDTGTGNDPLQAIKVFAAKPLQSGRPSTLGFQRHVKHDGDRTPLPSWVVTKFNRNNVNVVQRHLWADGTLDQVHRWTFAVEFTEGSFFDVWNDAVARPHLNALRHVPGTPVTLAPLLAPCPGEAVPRVASQSNIFDSPEVALKGALRSTDFKTVETASAWGSQGAQIGVEMVGVQPGSIENGFTASACASAIFPGFVTHNGQPLAANVIVAPDAAPKASPNGTRIGFGVLSFSQPVAANQQRVRLGALDIAFSEAANVGGTGPQSMSATVETLPPNRALTLGETPRNLSIAYLDLDFKMKVRSIDAGGQDIVPTEAVAQVNTSGVIDNAFERESPVVFAINGQRTNTEDFILHVTDRGAANKQRRIDLTLESQQTKSGAPQPRVVVLDRSPFLVAEVDFPDFHSQEADAGSSVLASWTNAGAEGPVWQVRAGQDQSASLILPPQAVGETMHKDHRLDGQKADFTLSAPAIANIRPSYNVQRFVEAPWNLRRILGYVGQRAPGAQVNSVQLELLYGLSCSTDYPFLRLAEIATQVGNIPGPLPVLQQLNPPDPVVDRYKQYAANWSDIYRQYRNRLALLQPWDTHQTGNLVINSRLSCDIRVPAANINRPVNGVCDPPVVNDFPSNDPKRIFGGAVGGFESNNIYCSVIRNPHSTGASLTNPILSSLGGFGTTMAEFDKGLSRISGDVQMGRTETYTLERFGRIAVLWNKAKHVIVYQRSADRGRQFADDASLRGRPVLRKISEYIELIDKERSYPEHEVAPAVRGFVAGSDFRNALRINVDGKWGRDVGNRGWKIPLWNAAAAMDNPTVYAKPRISFGIVCDDGGKAATLPADLEQPDQLYFYTSTELSASSNSDEWPAVQDVDFPNFPIPPCPTQHFPDAHTDHSLSPETQPGGYDNFTFRLAPPVRPANLVAERTTEAISALLHNVTLARSAGANGLDLDAARGLPHKLNDAYDNILGALAQKETLTATDVQALWDQNVVGAGKGAADKLKTDLFSGATKVCDFVKGQADTAFQSFLNSASAQAQNLTTRLAAYPQELKSFFDSVDVHTADWSRDNVVAEIDARFHDLRQQLDWWPQTPEPLQKLAQGVCEWIQSATNFVGQYDAARASLISAATAAIGGDHDKPISAAAANQVRMFVLQGEQTASGFIETLRTSVEHARPAWLPSSVLPTYAAEQALRDALLPPFASAGFQLASAISGVSAPKGDDILAVLNKLPTLAAVNADPNLQTVLKAGSVSAWSAAAHAVWNDWLDSELAKFHQHVIDLIPNPWPVADPSKIKAALDSAIVQLQKDLGASATEAEQKVRAYLKGKIDTAVDSVCTLLLSDLLPAIGGVDWNTLFNGASKKLDEFRQLLDDQIHKALADARPILEQAARLPGSIHIPSDALRLLRCFGEPPRVPGLDFNRDRLAYFFKTNVPAIDLSPVLTLADSAAKEVGDAAKQAAKAFQSFGLTLPSSKLLDRVIPHSLADFDISSVFRDFAGIRLAGLFPGLKLPAIDGDTGVQVRHGVDPQSKRAWMSARIDVPITTEQSLLAFGPLELSLIAPHFEADARMEAGADGTVQRNAHGAISGDWALRIGGTEIVRFQQTRMLFDENGNIRFEISASNVRLAPAFAFLNSLLSKAPGTGSGFSIEANLPGSVLARLDLGLPDLNIGTFGVSNLRLGCSFGLELAGEFALALNFALASRKAPFTLTIFILGGSGFIESSLRYVPSRPHALTCRVDVGLMASASLSIAIGPIRGGVYIYFGVTASLQLGGDDPRGFAIGIIILIRGVVSLLGIVDASLSLLLEATYDTGSKILQGRGRLEVSIKICWCFTLNISEEVHCELRPGGLGYNRSSEPVLLASDMHSGVMSDGALALLPPADNVTPNLVPRCDTMGGLDPIQFYLGEYLRMMEY